MEVVGAFWCQEWSGFFLALLSGILGVVVGLMLLGNPIQGGITLTVLLASFLFVGGIFKAVAALVSPLTILAMNSGRAWRTIVASSGSSMSIRWDGRSGGCIRARRPARGS